jgi:hypothetical protein
MVQYSVSSIITLHGRITARDYVGRLGKEEHPMIQTFPNNGVVFQDDNAPIHTAGTVSRACGELQHLPWPAQSYDLYITEPLLSVLEIRVRKRYPSLKQLEDVNEERYQIPQQTVQNLYESIPRRTAAVLKAKGGPTPYT